jgi:hypothetical protein
MAAEETGCGLCWYKTVSGGINWIRGGACGFDTVRKLGNLERRRSATSGIYGQQPPGCQAPTARPR